MPTIMDIRARYPHPRRSRGVMPAHEAESYCVGGACALSTGRPWRFPQTEQLVLVLQDLNPRLTRVQGRWYATRIIGANDHNNFEGAWRLVGAALTRHDERR